jgi:cell division protein FtsI/penicillin-binding protein 2
MKTPATTWRLYLLLAVPAAMLLALAGRVVHLQYCEGAELAERARAQQLSRVPLPGRPGCIFGRSRGGPVLIAGSRHAPTCFADPAFLGPENFDRAADGLAPLIALSSADIRRTLRERSDRRYARLARDLTEAEAEAVRRLRRERDLPGVGIHHEWRRTYPLGPLAAQVVGFRRIDGVPGAGVELACRRWLAAADGQKTVRTDARRRGRYALLENYHPPRDGHNVFLTVDVMMQGFLEGALFDTVEQFQAEAGMAVLMDPRTGDILAMASAPSYSPPDYRRSRPEQRRNRVITDPYEPGSAFKPFIAAGAVQMGVAGLDTEFFCHHGTYRAHRGGTIRDFPGERFGSIPLSEVVIHSSNIGMAKLGERLGDERLHRIARAFGFGEATGVELPGEHPGRLVTTRHWTGYATRRMPFGQGPIMVTNLQLARAFCAIANGGELLRPRLVDRVIDADGHVVHRNERQCLRRVLEPAVARRMVEDVLAKVVERGTGKRCRMDRWRAFGKTGTAQIGTRHGYEERAYTATFVAGAPVDRPALVCAVSIYRPDYDVGHTGGKVAAPCVRRVLEQSLAYLGVPSDTGRLDGPEVLLAGH